MAAGDLGFEYSLLHHYDIVAIALNKLERELDSSRREELLRMLEQRLKKMDGAGNRTQ